MIRTIVSRSQAALWSLYPKDLLRHHRLQEDCDSVLQNSVVHAILRVRSIVPAALSDHVVEITSEQASGLASWMQSAQSAMLTYQPERILNTIVAAEYEPERLHPSPATIFGLLSGTRIVRQDKSGSGCVCPRRTSPGQQKTTSCLSAVFRKIRL